MKWVKLLIAVLLAVVASNPIMERWLDYYTKHFATPIISCEKGVSTEGELLYGYKISIPTRSVSMNLRPLILVEFDNKIFMNFYLKAFYENEWLEFSDNISETKIQNQIYVEVLIPYIRYKIEAYMKENNEGKYFNVKKFDVYLVTLGGIRYVNEEGNSPKEYCFIERDGEVLDFEKEEEIIKHLLYYVTISTQEDSSLIERDEDINTLVMDAANKMIEYLHESS